MKSTDKAISVRELVKNYSNKPVLDKLSFDVLPGQTVALLGPNGAGKTTLVRSIAGLQKYDSGNISVMGNNAGSLSSRLMLGVMLQDSELPDALTAAEMFNLFSSFYRAPNKKDVVFEIADLHDIQYKPYGQLSGGQKRRVQLALALSGNPEIIILDEPTAHMDSSSRKKLWAAIESLRSDGKTVLLVTHQMEEVDALGSQVIILDKGKIIANSEVSKFRAEFSASTIICNTVLDVSTVLQFPFVKHATKSGRKLEVVSHHSDDVLKQLIISDPNLSELEVSQPSLESIINCMMDNQSTLKGDSK